MLRSLLAEAAEAAHHAVGELAEDDHGDVHVAPFTFEDIMYLVLILWLIYFGGKLAGKTGLPELVGQMMAGIALGPHGLEIAPKHDALMLMGELGLVLMVLEAGIEVELSELSVVGQRGVVVALLGSMLPLGMGTALAAGVFSMNIKSALAVGASLAPTSMGISLKVLEEGKVLSTPTGQLIIAAAVIDDVIALVLLAQLEALADPTPINFIIPIISSLSFIFILGYAAVKIVPGLLANHVVPRLPIVHLEHTLLGMVLLAGSVLMVVCHYSKSSHLLGAFLGGLMFCTLSSVKSVWHHKVKSLLQWLVRIFFACSVAFEVPIRDLWTGPILARAAVFLLCALGKLATGAFARPYTHREAATIGFAMSAWGEFAFIVATASREAGTLDSDTYGAIILAVLVSAIYSPLAVKLAVTQRGAHETARNEMFMQQGAADHPKDAAGHTLHKVYYIARVQTASKWGLMDSLMKCVHELLELDVVDFRVHNKGGSSCFELYLRDRKLWAPNTHVSIAPYSDQVDKVATRAQETLQEKFHSSPVDVVMLQRWVPNLDDDAQHDDSIAYEQAEREFQEEYPSEFGSASISGGGLGHSASMMVLQKAEEQNEELVALKVMSRPDALLHKLVLQGRRELTKRARRRSESLHEGLAGASSSMINASSRSMGYGLQDGRNPMYLHRPSVPRHRVRRQSADHTLSKHVEADEDSMSEDLEGGNNEARATMTLSGAQGSELAREVLQSMQSNIRRASTVDLSEVDVAEESAGGRESFHRESSGRVDALGELPDFDQGAATSGSMSTMTLSGAMGLSLAQEVRKELENRKDAPF